MFCILFRAAKIRDVVWRAPLPSHPHPSPAPPARVVKLLYTPTSRFSLPSSSHTDPRPRLLGHPPCLGWPRSIVLLALPRTILAASLWFHRLQSQHNLDAAADGLDRAYRRGNACFVHCKAGKCVPRRRLSRSRGLSRRSRASLSQSLTCHFPSDVSVLPFSKSVLPSTRVGLHFEKRLPDPFRTRTKVQTCTQTGCPLQWLTPLCGGV